MSDVTSFELTSDTQSYAIKNHAGSSLAYCDVYEWFMASEDGYLTLDNELTESLMESVTGLVWGQCVDYNITDPASYGLDSPMATVTVNYVETVQVETGETDDDGNAVTETQERNASFVLEIGNYSGDGCYARIAGSNMVYLIDAGISDTLLYTSYADLRPDEVLRMNWDEVNAVDILLDGETYSLVKATVEATDDEGNATEETVYMLNGIQIAIEDVLDELTSMSSTAYAYGTAPERSQEIGFVIYRDSKFYPEVELSFYQYDSSSCLVSLNGETTVYVAREDVVSLVEDVTTLLLG